MKTDLLNMADTIEAGVKKLKGLLESYIKDKNVPLEDRWEVYSTLPAHYFDESRWVMDYDFAGTDIVWHDDLYMEKYETVDNLVIIERIENKLEYEKLNGGTEEDILQLKEDMLQSGIRRWTYDW